MERKEINLAMTIEKQINKVTLINESIIKASSNSTTTTLPLSTFDLGTGGFPVTFFYAYTPPYSSSINIVSISRSSLTQTLTHFFPFAGWAHINTGHILCNNEGVRFLEASGDFRLSALDFYLLDQVKEAVMLPVDHDVLLTLQLTMYTCGGFTLAWTYNHVVCDATGFGMFLSCFYKIARAQVSRLPANSLSTTTSGSCYSHDRSAMLIPRPNSHRSCRSNSVEQSYVVRSVDEMHSLPPQKPGRFEPTHVYYVKGSCIDDLQRRASQTGGRPRTKFEALSAYIWKAMATTLDGTKHDKCQMGWIVEGRRWWAGIDHDHDLDKMKNFVGNLIVIAAGEEEVKDLKEKTLAKVASIVSASIHEACNQDYFMEVRDYMECNYPKVVVPKLILGLGGVPGLLVNGLHRIPMMDDGDFGFGGPSLCVALPTLESYPCCYLNVVSSGRKDGSWFVYAMLWPELARALESDPNHNVFVPITSYHIFGE